MTDIINNGLEVGLIFTIAWLITLMVGGFLFVAAEVYFRLATFVWAKSDLIQGKRKEKNDDL